MEKNEPLIFEETQEEKDKKLEEEMMHVETVCGLTMDRIIFMKQYFKEKGYDPEANNFEELVLDEI